MSLLPVQEDVFKLQHLLDANLLKKCEDVEDLAAAAVKEKQIERKLDVLRGEWAVQEETTDPSHQTMLQMLSWLCCIRKLTK